MMSDEEDHIQALKDIYNSLTSEQLISPMDSTMVDKLKSVQILLDKYVKSSIKSLDDAYEISHDIENSELNSIFNFLTNKFTYSEKRKEFYLLVVKNHLRKITLFSGSIPTAR